MTDTRVQTHRAISALMQERQQLREELAITQTNLTHQRTVAQYWLERCKRAEDDLKGKA